MTEILFDETAYYGIYVGYLGNIGLNIYYPRVLIVGGRRFC